ncbi:hypothetical protein [Streptomyces spiramenti]|uniref:ABC transporter substrate-binding protein n=1 Tax=Streptomyces spiramenti TaxID=2720606 RepID=A0ABX1AIH8_9ACTN|nr:hypothetical protein [Streptomyces spiramenti]NJP65716.1 hypothetical protein [Streptomyces spiramenti]
MELPESPAGIPPWPGVESFIRNLDRALASPRERATELVLVVEELPGQAAAQLLGGLREHCTSDGRVLAPRVLLSIGADDDLVGLVDECADSLSTLPSGAGRLRLRQYELLRQVASTTNLPTAPTHRSRQLRRQLYESRSREELNGEFAERLPDRLSWLGGALGLVVWTWRRWVGEWMFARRTNRLMTGRRSWFARWSEAQSGNPCADFFAVAHQLAPGGKLSDRTGAALLHALLHDLDRSVRGALWSPWRARRTRYLILAKAGGDGEDVLRNLIADYRQATGALGSRATLLFARVTPARCAELGVTEHASLDAVPGPAARNRDAQAVAVTAPTETLPAGVFRREKMPPRAVLGVPAGLTLRVAALLCVLGLLGTGGVLAVESARNPCPDGQFLATGRELCVGISDGRTLFKGMAEEFEAEFERIAENNETAQERTHTRTVAHVASYTGAHVGSKFVQQSALDELRGIALAQEHLNKESARWDGVALKIVLVNAGPRFESGAEVAQRLNSLVKQDKEVVAVVGLGQSREGTYTTMTALDESGVAMVGTTATAQQMQEYPHYFQVAPDNRRQAEVAVAFTEGHLMATAPDEDRNAVEETVVIAFDDEDDYSADLAKQFRAAYGKEVQNVPYTAQYPTDRHDEAQLQDPSKVTEAICGRTSPQRNTVLFWAGRAGDLVTVMDGFGSTENCGTVTVLGGDAIASAPIEESALRDGDAIHYLTPAVPGAPGNTSRAEVFRDAYNAAWEEGYAGAALGWDAMAVVEAAVRSVVGAGAEFDHSHVRQALHSGNTDVVGVTGVLEPGSSEPSARPVFVMETVSGVPTIVGACGPDADRDWRWDGSDCPDL